MYIKHKSLWGTGQKGYNWLTFYKSLGEWEQMVLAWVPVLVSKEAAFWGGFFLFI